MKKCVVPVSVIYACMCTCLESGCERCMTVFCFPSVPFTSGTDAESVTAAALYLSLCKQQLSPWERKCICCSHKSRQRLRNTDRCFKSKLKSVYLFVYAVVKFLRFEIETYSFTGDRNSAVMSKMTKRDGWKLQCFGRKSIKRLKGRKMSQKEDKVVVLNLAIFVFWLKWNTLIENNLTHNLS